MEARQLTVAMVCLAISACTHDQSVPADVAKSQPVDPVAAPVTPPAPIEQSEPAPATMQRAIRSGKLSAPVDVLFRFSDDVATGRPVRIDFAVSPSVAGDNLRFELVESDSALIESADYKLAVQKADARGVYRKSVTMTPRAGLTKLQAIVYLTVGTDIYSGVYTIPIGAAAAKKKDGKEPAKQRLE